MPNTKPARGIYRCRSCIKPIACFSTLTRTRYSSVFSGDKIQHSQLPSETNNSYCLPAAGACPMEDGTLRSQGCPTDLCMLASTFPFTPGLLHFSSFYSPKIYFKLSSPHLSTQLHTALAAARQSRDNGVESKERARHGHTLLSPANLTTFTPS